MQVQHILDIESHGIKIYTRAMFEQFGEMLYKGLGYLVEEIQKDMLYINTWQGTRMPCGVKSGAESNSR